MIKTIVTFRNVSETETKQLSRRRLLAQSGCFDQMQQIHQALPGNLFCIPAPFKIHWISLVGETLNLFKRGNNAFHQEIADGRHPTYGNHF